MSRIGKLPISIPAGVTVTLKDDVVTVNGPKGRNEPICKSTLGQCCHRRSYVVLTENEKCNAG